MNRLSRRLPVLVLLALVLAGSVGFAGYRLVGLDARVVQEVADTRWQISQLEVEYQRFRGIATGYILGAPDLGQEALLRGYDILWSRFPVLLEGDESQALRSLQGFDATVDRTFAEFRELEAAVLALRHGEPSQYAPFFERLDPIGETIRVVVLDTLAFDRWADSYRGYTLGQPKLDLILAVSVFIAVSSLLFGLLWREVQLSNAEIAQRQKTEAKLRDALDTAERASRTKNSFLANVSHELRTPLNAILGFAEMVRTEVFGPVDGRNREYVNDIYVSAEHLHRLVDEILDLARVEAGAMQLYETQLSVEALLRTCCDLTGNQAQGRDMQVVLECERALPALYADETKVRQVIINLLTNAIKYSPPSDRIELSAARAPDGGLVFKVADRGPGISADHLAQVFEPFNRVTNDTYTRSRGHTGSGLGLAIARTFVQLHQGSISIDSHVGTGTTVTVTFPADRVIEQPPVSATGD